MPDPPGSGKMNALALRNAGAGAAAPPHPETPAVCSCIPKKLGTRPKVVHDRVEARPRGRPSYWQYDFVAIASAKQVGEQQILFVVKTISPFRRVVPGKQNVMKAPDYAWRQHWQHLRKEHRHVRV